MKSRRIRVVKIAISLPKSLHQAIERERGEAGLSRSAFVRKALEESMARRQRAALVARYVEGYRRSPETASEIAVAESAAAEAFAQEPWE